MTTAPIESPASPESPEDGMTFEKWRFEINRAISDLGREAYLDRETAPMFSSGFDPKTAAHEWLRKRVAIASPPEEQQQ